MLRSGGRVGGGSRGVALRGLIALAFAAALVACDGAPDEPSPTLQPSAEETRQLESIGYINVVPVPAPLVHREGVTKLDEAAAYPGLNLFNSRQERVARLMTMDGRVVHRWASDVSGRAYERFREVLPAYLPSYLDGWNHIELHESGDLLVIGTHHMLLRLDWRSNVEWKLDLSVHHDLALSDDGDIYVLTDGLRTTEIEGEPVTFQDNYVVRVGPDGEVEDRISLFDAFEGETRVRALRALLSRARTAQQKRLARLRAAARPGHPQDERLVELYEAAIRGETSLDPDIQNILFHGHDADIFHTNSIEILDRASPGLWHEGDLLLSIRSLNRIAVLDREARRITWTWGEDTLQGQHDARPLENGNILLFDNGPRRKYSRVVEVDPRRRRIAWEYRADPPESLYSFGASGAAPLPNGNVLVTETDRGHAFEITREGGLVWEYYSELVGDAPNETDADPGGALRGAIYRMTRIERAAVERLLDPRPSE